MDPLLIRQENLGNLRRGEIGQVNGVSRRFNHHIVKAKPGENQAIAIRVQLKISEDSRVEIFNDSDLPIDGGFRREPEDFRGALVLVADAEWTFRLGISRVKRVFGFEIGGSSSPSRREDNPPVRHLVFPDFGVPTIHLMPPRPSLVAAI